MKKPHLEISIELSDEPNPELVKAFTEIVSYIAMTMLTIGHPELGVEDAVAVINVHDPY